MVSGKVEILSQCTRWLSVLPPHIPRPFWLPPFASLWHDMGTDEFQLNTMAGSTYLRPGFEGADEAAKYYQRNLRIYSNLNRIPMTNEDRVFILSGGSHTAFLNEFMKRSPKYEVVNTMDYLK